MIYVVKLLSTKSISFFFWFNEDEHVTYLSIRLFHPWYPTLMRLSTVEDRSVSFLEETKMILNPLSLISWKSLNVCSRAGALLSFIHASKEVAFSFSPLIRFLWDQWGSNEVNWCRTDKISAKNSNVLDPFDNVSFFRLSFL